MNQDSQAGPGRDIHASRGPLPAIFQRNLAILAPWSAPARRRFIRASLPPRSTRISSNHLLPLSRRVCAALSHLAFALGPGPSTNSDFPPEPISRVPGFGSDR